MNFAQLVDSGTDGARQAALLLHTLAPDDKDWLLMQLPEEQSTQLRGLVAELDALGLLEGADLNTQSLLGAPSTLRAFKAASSVENAVVSRASPDADDTEFLSALNTHGVQCLAKLWSAEPAKLVALALSAHLWPWRSNLLAYLPTAQRRRVEDAMHGLGVSRPGALVRAMLSASRERLADSTVLGLSDTGERKSEHFYGVYSQANALPVALDESPVHRLWRTLKKVFDRNPVLQRKDAV